MLPITHEWVNKAEGGWLSLNREIQVQNTLNYDLVCFLARQCAEKYVKARLQEGGIAFPKTHDLTLLLGLVLPIQPLWSVLEQPLRVLKNYAVRYRYPGDNADKKKPKKQNKIVRPCATRQEAV